MKKVLSNIIFYFLFVLLAFGIGYYAPWMVIGVGIGALLIGIFKGVKKAYLALRKRLIKR